MKKKRKPWISLRNPYFANAVDATAPHWKIIYEELGVILKILYDMVEESILILWMMHGTRQFRRFVWYVSIGWWTKEED